MRTDKLGIYVDVYNLYNVIFEAQFQMTKTNRIILGDKMLQKCEDLFGHIAMANNLRDRRIEYIDTFISEFETLKIELRLACEKSIVSEDKTKLALFSHVARIDEGIGKWRNATISRHDAKVKQSSVQSEAELKE